MPVAAMAVVVAGAVTAGVGPGLELLAGGRRRLPHSGSEAVSSPRLHHGLVREGEGMERKGGGEVSKVIWNENKGVGGFK